MGQEGFNLIGALLLPYDGTWMALSPLRFPQSDLAQVITLLKFYLFLFIYFPAYKERRTILGGLDEIQSKTCIDFYVFNHTHALDGYDYVYITKARTGCWSHIGRVGGGAQVRDCQSCVHARLGPPPEKVLKLANVESENWFRRNLASGKAASTIGPPFTRWSTPWALRMSTSALTEIPTSTYFGRIFHQVSWLHVDYPNNSLERINNSPLFCSNRSGK